MKLETFILMIVLFSGLVLAECEEDQIDLNEAKLSELDKIIWIGEATAEKIKDTRPFDSLEDLRQVSGIGETKFEDIKAEGLACVEEEEEEEEMEGEEELVNEEKIIPEAVFVERDIVELNSVNSESEIVYESVESKISKYAPLIFVMFLLILVGVIVVSR